MTKTLLIEVLSEDNASSAAYATELRDVLLDSIPTAEVEMAAPHGREMDFGSTLVLVLGTQAAIELAKGLSGWLKKRNAAKVRIKATDGETIVEVEAESINGNEVIQAIDRAVTGIHTNR